MATGKQAATVRNLVNDLREQYKTWSRSEVSVVDVTDVLPKENVSVFVVADLISNGRAVSTVSIQYSVGPRGGVRCVKK